MNQISTFRINKAKVKHLRPFKLDIFPPQLLYSLYSVCQLALVKHNSTVLILTGWLILVSRFKQGLTCRTEV